MDNKIYLCPPKLSGKLYIVGCSAGEVIAIMLTFFLVLLLKSIYLIIVPAAIFILSFRLPGSNKNLAGYFKVRFKWLFSKKNYRR